MGPRAVESNIPSISSIVPVGRGVGGLTASTSLPRVTAAVKRGGHAGRFVAGTGEAGRVSASPKALIPKTGADQALEERTAQF